MLRIEEMDLEELKEVFHFPIWIRCPSPPPDLVLFSSSYLEMFLQAAELGLPPISRFVEKMIRK